MKMGVHTCADNSENRTHDQIYTEVDINGATIVKKETIVSYSFDTDTVTSEETSKVYNEEE